MYVYVRQRPGRRTLYGKKETTEDEAVWESALIGHRDGAVSGDKEDKPTMFGMVSVPFIGSLWMADIYLLYDFLFFFCDY